MKGDDGGQSKKAGRSSFLGGIFQKKKPEKKPSSPLSLAPSAEPPQSARPTPPVDTDQRSFMTSIDSISLRTSSSRTDSLPISVELVLPQAISSTGQHGATITSHSQDETAVVFLSPGIISLSGIVRITNISDQVISATRLAVLLFSGQGRSKANVHDPEAPSATMIHNRPLHRSSSLIWAGDHEIVPGTHEFPFSLPFAVDLVPTIHTPTLASAGKDISHWLYVGMRMKENPTLCLGHEVILRRCVARMRSKWETILGVTGDGLLAYKVLVASPNYIGDDVSVSVQFAQTPTSLGVQARYLQFVCVEKFTFRGAARPTYHEHRLSEPLTFQVSFPTSPYLDGAPPLVLPFATRTAQADFGTYSVVVSHEGVITIGVDTGRGIVESSFKFPLRMVNAEGHLTYIERRGYTQAESSGRPESSSGRPESVRSGSTNNTWETSGSGATGAVSSEGGGNGMVNSNKFRDDVSDFTEDEGPSEIRNEVESEARDVVRNDSGNEVETGARLARGLVGALRSQNPHRRSLFQNRPARRQNGLYAAQEAPQSPTTPLRNSAVFPVNISSPPPTYSATVSQDAREMFDESGEGDRDWGVEELGEKLTSAAIASESPKQNNNAPIPIKTDKSTSPPNTTPVPAASTPPEKPASPPTDGKPTPPARARSAFVEKYISSGGLPTVAALDQALLKGEVTGGEYVRVKEAMARVRELDEKLVREEVSGEEYVRCRDGILRGVRP
ncbi:hypothetical protein HDV00_003584 [Rhizophlyctis rosea]|nr:hypothetical protein HDV00_003584 [Rhizophlyctis rosea]